jgi:hypothetical protein
MKYYAISYDLNKQDKNYDGLYDAIKNFNYYHVMDSVWFIKTNFTSLEVYNKLKPQIDTNDFLFVSEINSNYYGFLQKDVWNWLKI